MGEVIPFRRPKLSDVHKGKTLCKTGFHDWKIVTSQRFDVKQGKLLTIYRCSRCGTEKSEKR